ncbi:hypothetical protein FGB62_181g020 [Gracilaria domingensis]|nr:hypothetical protein FGB62_181g020 [Gracilaria domingensis]
MADAVSAVMLSVEIMPPSAGSIAKSASDSLPRSISSVSNGGREAVAMPRTIASRSIMSSEDDITARARVGRWVGFPGMGDERKSPLLCERSFQRRAFQVQTHRRRDYTDGARDAPPTSCAPDEKEEVANDEAARKRLASQIPEFATDILKCSRDVDALIDVIEGKIKQQKGQEISLFDTANFESNQAGKEMVEAVYDAQKTTY